VGDDPLAVLQNRQYAAEALGFSLESLVCAEQVHGNRAAVVTKEDAGRGAVTGKQRSKNRRATDGYLWDSTRLILCRLSADLPG